MADVYIDISKDESARFALFDLYATGIYDLKIDSFSISMNADQLQQLCDNLRPRIVDDSAKQAPPAAVPEGYALVPVDEFALLKPVREAIEEWRDCRSPLVAQQAMYKIEAAIGPSAMLAAAREGES